MQNDGSLNKRLTGRRRPREVLRCGITDAALNGETALFDIVPGIGKSRSIPKIANGTKKPFTYLTNLEENYGQAKDWAGEDGAESKILPTRDLCPTLRPDNPAYPDDTEAQKARSALGNNWSVSDVHGKFDLPCQRGEETCPYCERVAEVDADGLQMLIGHYSQGFNPAYVDDRVVVIDENPFDTFYEVIEYPAKKAQKYIDTLGDFPFNEVRRPEIGEEEKREKAVKRLEEEGLEPSDHTDCVGEFHALAPKIAYTIFGGARADGKGSLIIQELPGGGCAHFEKIHEGNGDQYDDGRPTMWIPNVPDFSRAEAVIALDGTPSCEQWEFVIGDFEHYRLFDNDDRNRYLREQGYEFIQVNSHIWSAQGGNLSIPKCEAYLREVYREHGERPDLITSRAILGEKDGSEGLKDRELDHLWNREMTFGSTRSVDAMGDSELLVVLGSPSRSDSYYQRIAGLFGEHAEPATDEDGNRLKGYDLDYQSEVANDVLKTTRRGGVFQAAMRAGRTDDTEATVYIATGMVPDWLETKKAGRVTASGSFDACPKRELRSPGEREVIEALRGADGISASELVDRVDLGEDMVKNHRQSLQEDELIEKEGERRWARYSDNGLDEVNIAGKVDLSLSGTMPIKNSIWGSYPIESRPEPIMPCRDPPDNPEDRYPDWMRKIQREARWSREREQEKRRGDTA